MAVTWKKLAYDVNLIKSSAVIADHKLLRGDAGSRNIQDCDIVVSDNGEMTNPSQPAFAANLTAQLNDVTGDATIYDLTGAIWTEVFDQGNNFSGGIFTAPVDGRYLFVQCVSFAGILPDHTRGYTQLITTPKPYSTGEFNPGNVCSSTGVITSLSSVLVLLNADETAFIRLMFRGFTKVIDIRTVTTFAGVLIC